MKPQRLHLFNFIRLIIMKQVKKTPELFIFITDSLVSPSDARTSKLYQNYMWTSLWCLFSGKFIIVFISVCVCVFFPTVFFACLIFVSLVLWFVFQSMFMTWRRVCVSGDHQIKAMFTKYTPDASIFNNIKFL